MTALADPAASTPPDSYADTVFDSSDLSTNPVYDDPAAALGRPTTLVDGIYDTPRGVYHASMVYAPYNQHPKGTNLLVVLGSDGMGEVTVKFNTPIVHDPHHWYGDDLIVYGNPSFIADGAAITPTVDMNTVFIQDGSIYQNGVPTVSVSADGTNFVALTPDGTFWPTNPYLWAGVSSDHPSGWAGFADFTKPVNPSLNPSDFAGLSVVAATSLYAGSAGGEAFSLAGTGFETTGIEYVRFSGLGNIDAVARVSANPAPLSPLALGATATSSSSISLDWSPSTDAQSYNIYRGVVSGGESATPYATVQTGHKYTDGGVQAGTTYFYTVTAVNKHGESDPASPEASAQPGTTGPSAPADVSVVAQSETAQLMWNAVTGAASYNIYRGINGGANVIYSSGITAVTFDDQDVQSGNTYTYDVVSVDADGQGGHSKKVTVTF